MATVSCALELLAGLHIHNQKTNRPKRKNRSNASVLDFHSEDGLRQALEKLPLPTTINDDNPTKKEAGPTSNSASVSATAAASTAGPHATPTTPSSSVIPGLEWMLTNADPAVTEPQSLTEELHRLQVLKSYMILDTDGDASLDRLTKLATRVLGVPIALISLVDLGRIWFLSNRGLGSSVKEIPRQTHSFCAHTIVSKQKINVVPDALLDPRFCHSPLVTGPPFVRFYAGVPLMAPEGYKIGTFCVIDSKPRGFTRDDELSLHDFADLAVQELVHRRELLHQCQDPAELIACAAHDLLTPLEGVQTSLQNLLQYQQQQQHNNNNHHHGDDSDPLSEHHMELLHTAASCSKLMSRICHTAMASANMPNEHKGFNNNNSHMPTTTSCHDIPTTNMAELFNNLALITEPIRKHTPVAMSLDPQVPAVVVCDDLPLFRTCLNLLSHAMGRTEQGLVHFRAFVKQGKNTDSGASTTTASTSGQQNVCHASREILVFECRDTGPNVEVQDYPYLFQPSRSATSESEEGDKQGVGLSTVAALVESLDGECGFYPRNDDASGCSKPTLGPLGLPLPPTQQRGAVFWFSVPLRRPEHFGMNIAEADHAPVSLIRSTSSTSSVPHILRHNGTSCDNLTLRTSSGNCLLGCGGGSTASLLLHSTTRPPRNTSQQVSLGNSCSGSSFEPTHVKNQKNATFEDILPMPGAASSKSATASHPSTVSFRRVNYNSAGAVIPRKRRALVIEDTNSVRKMLARVIDNLGLESEQAVNGLDGLEKMKGAMFDFVLCDFLMPVMDGLDCVKQYRQWEQEHRPGFRMVIVGISAHADANHVQKGLVEGMDDFKPKPISRKLISEIHQSALVMATSQMIDESMVVAMDEDPIMGAAVAIPNDPDSISVSMNHIPSSNDTLSLISSEAPPSMVDVPSQKRVRVDLPSTVAAAAITTKGCLVASATAAVESNYALNKLEQKGWTVIVVRNGEEAFNLLKLRNWEAVLIDDTLPVLDGARCMQKFRDWETQNRVNRQLNSFFVCSEPIPSGLDKRSNVQAPTGFDSVLGHPIQWNELNYKLSRKRHEQLSIILPS